MSLIFGEQAMIVDFEVVYNNGCFSQGLLNGHFWIEGFFKETLSVVLDCGLGALHCLLGLSTRIVY